MHFVFFLWSIFFFFMSFVLWSCFSHANFFEGDCEGKRGRGKKKKISEAVSAKKFQWFQKASYEQFFFCCYCCCRLLVSLGFQLILFFIVELHFCCCCCLFAFIVYLFVCLFFAHVFFFISFYSVFSFFFFLLILHCGSHCL